MLSMMNGKYQSPLGFFPPGSPLRLGSSLACKGRRSAAPGAVRAMGRSARAPSDPRVGSGCQEESLCAQTDPRAGRPRSGEELAAPLGSGASSREVSLLSSPGSGAPRAGPDPPTARERPEELEPRRPGPSASRRPGTRTRDAPSTSAQGAAGLLPQPRAAVGSSAWPVHTFRTALAGTAVHTFRRALAGRPHLQDGRRPAPPSTLFGTGAGRHRAPSSQPPGRRVRLHLGARAQRGSQASRLGR